MLTTNAVQFGRAMPVTNAACCSSQTVQCPRCAAAALAAATPTVNVPPAVPMPPTPSLDELLGPAPTVNVAYDDEPPLLPPEIVWGEGGIPGRAVDPAPNLTINVVEEPPLIPPTL